MRYIPLLLRIYRKHRIDFIFHYTIKPNIYGSIATRLLRIPSIAVVTGLGLLFTHISWKTWVAKTLYRLALRRAYQIWFLNESDGTIFEENRITRSSKIRYLPGEGFDTGFFQQSEYGLLHQGPFTFLLAARLIEEKGIREYVEAARIFQSKGLKARFQLLGFIENVNPHGITHEEINRWEAEGLITYLGQTDDVKPYLERTDCLVLPTYYREGVPRILLEGASMKIPHIATDNVGCRQVIEHGLNGFLCRRQNAGDLARYMMLMASLPHEERKKQGILGRQRVRALFDEDIIIRKYLSVLEQFFGPADKSGRKAGKARMQPVSD